MTSEEKTIRVGVWGLGRHARRNILPALQECPSTTLVGVTSRNQDVVGTESSLNECRAWATPELMLADASVDAVYIATPTGLHFDHGMQALGAGKHLWCEKPLAVDLVQVDKLLRESHARNLAVCEGLMYLYHPQFSKIADLIADGSLGKILSLKTDFGIPHLKQPGFRFTKALGGGALLDVAPYPLSAALALLGPELVLVESSVIQDPGVEVDTHGHALLRTRAGTSVFLEWGYERAYRNVITVWGEFGSLSSDYIFSKPSKHVPCICMRDTHGQEEFLDVPQSNSFVMMFSTFACAVDDVDLRMRLGEEARVRAQYLEALKPTR